jgi:hypothetical protein
VEVQRIEVTVGDSSFIDISQMKIRKNVVNGIRTKSANGPFIINTPIDITYLHEVRTYKKQGGQYRLMPFKLPIVPFCEFLNKDVTFIPAWLESTNMTRPVPCPVPQVNQRNSFP